MNLAKIQYYDQDKKKKGSFVQVLVVNVFGMISPNRVVLNRQKIIKLSANSNVTILPNIKSLINVFIEINFIIRLRFEQVLLCSNNLCNFHKIIFSILYLQLCLQ